MEQVYKPNIVLWLEDEIANVQMSVMSFNRNQGILDAFGDKLELVTSDTRKELKGGEAVAEIEDIIERAGDAPTVVNLQTAQLGRTFFERYIPTAAISDTSFPLNGEKIVQWLYHHDFKDYPLLGFSGTAWSELSEVVKEFFIKSHARYLEKGGVKPPVIAGYILFARMCTMDNYGHQEGSASR